MSPGWLTFRRLYVLHWATPFHGEVRPNLSTRALSPSSLRETDGVLTAPLPPRSRRYMICMRRLLCQRDGAATVVDAKCDLRPLRRLCIRSDGARVQLFDINILLGDNTNYSEILTVSIGHISLGRERRGTSYLRREGPL